MRDIEGEVVGGVRNDKVVDGDVVVGDVGNDKVVDIVDIVIICWKCN